MLKKVILLAIAYVFLFGCSKNDDSSNNNCTKAENISVDQVNSNSVLFSWDTGGNSAFEFEYGISGFGIGSGEVVQTSLTNYLVEGLEPLSTYEIFLRSNCGSEGFSEYISASFTTLENVALCNTPSNLALVSVTSSTIELSWDENNETEWEVTYGAVGHVPGTGIVLTTSDPNIEITGVQSSTTYEIYVRANCNVDGFSEYSDALVVTSDN